MGTGLLQKRDRNRRDGHVDSAAAQRAPEGAGRPQPEHRPFEADMTEGVQRIRMLQRKTSERRIVRKGHDGAVQPGLLENCPDEDRGGSKHCRLEAPPAIQLP